MAKGLALVDMEALVAKYMLLSVKHSMGHGTLQLDTLCIYLADKIIVL
jgi:hypothetical protein